MSIPKVSQVKAARALLEWSQANLAKKSGVSLPTIKRLEAAGGSLGGAPETREKIVDALTKAGIEFIPENGGGVGARLKQASAKAKKKLAMVKR